MVRSNFGNTKTLIYYNKKSLNYGTSFYYEKHEKLWKTMVLKYTGMISMKNNGNLYTKSYD